MSVELKVPNVGESITEVQIGSWLKQEGDSVEKDEPVVEIETDKVTVEVPAPEAGVLGKVLKSAGEAAAVGDVIGLLESNGASSSSSVSDDKKKSESSESKNTKSKASEEKSKSAAKDKKDDSSSPPEDKASPEDKSPAKDKESVKESAEDKPTTKGKVDSDRYSTKSESKAAPKQEVDLEDAELVPMTPLRRRIAERLVEAQRNAAILTTFNEVDMSEVIALRKEYQEAFQQRYGVKLGFMSFFVKAVVEGLKEVPQVNAQMHGNSIAFFKRYDIGVAVGGGKGLVVPVIRHADRLGFGQIEQTIADLGGRARNNTLELHELQGGTFTISNGGIYGSMLSTPILNPPQSGILGLHAIQERAVVRNGQVVVRPMMYLALSYDHRIVDGREAVTFLKRVKETIETPLRIMIEL
ncbi:MAG: 2-oxoglutarate dehydrogenase complex dihydrolipoyllysine-residue succinyltransferase [Phycisphaeraceae bacterium]|nr:2-oxoglutarate dehydrogenase complex dihydrolipoyllysine-residue succinyltransferase [Phycisphaeraceae bacterium]